MKTYNISFKYSKNGSSWTSANRSIKADSDSGAIMQIQSLFPYTKDIKIVSAK